MKNLVKIIKSETINKKAQDSGISTDNLGWTIIMVVVLILFILFLGWTIYNYFTTGKVTLFGWF